MGMSRPAVESTLFRARRRLTEEYDDLVSGARCLRIQDLIRSAVSTRLGTREQRRLSRHVAHCQPCRREALAAGLDSAILTHVPLPKRAARKIAALLPFPWLARWRGGDGGAGWAAQAPMLSEQLSGGWGKLATAAAVLVAGMGAAGVGSRVAGSDDGPPAGRDRTAGQERTAARTEGGGAGKATQTTRGSVQAKDAERGGKKESRRSRRAGTGSDRRDSSAGSPGTLTPASGTTGGNESADADPGGGSGHAAAGGGGGGTGGVNLPAGGQEPVRPVKETVDGVVQTVEPVVQGVTETVQQVVEPVVEPVEQTVQGVQQTVNGLTGGGQSGSGGGGLLPPP
jgi:hypothetical protein